MRKKIFIPEIYPLNRDLNKRWFVQLWIKVEGEDKRVKVWVPNETSLELRLSESQKIIDRLNKEGFKTREKKEPDLSYNLHISYLSLHLKTVQPTLRRKTFFTYATHIKNLNKFCSENKIASFDPVGANKFISHLTNSGKSARTINAHRVTFNSFYTKLIKQGIFKTNPFEDTLAAKGVSVGSTYLKSYQIAQIKAYVNKKENGLEFMWFAIRFIYYCFIRPGELRNLKVGDIDFDDWQIKVKGTISKNGKEQYVIIPEALRKELIPLCLYQYPSDYYLIGKNGLPSSQQIAINYLTRHHLKTLRALNYPNNYNLYSWKHTGVVHAYKAGLGLKELQMQLRHHSLDMVKIYLESLGILDFANISQNFPAI